MRLNDIAALIEEMSPLSLQEGWDNSGFQIKLGNPEISRILVAMEVTDSVIDEAVSEGAKLIVTHHPLIFGKIKSVDDNDVTGNYLCRLIQAGISVYSSHTPFDKCEGGNNDYLGKLLHLRDLELLPGDDSRICRVGLVDGDCSVEEYVLQISKWLNLDKSLIRFTGCLQDKVEKVGLCSGAGADFLELARDADCDLFITGDVKYHTAQFAKETGMNLLDLGHFGTEYLFTENMAARLREKILSGVTVVESKVDLNPFMVI